MKPYSGFEPEVGEIRAVRTFRMNGEGRLFSLFNDAPWSAGMNTAHCDLDEVAQHRAPDPDCSCGYYAYASAQGATELAAAHHVLAVVSCWGRIVAGTRGVRAEHVAIDAIWLSSVVPTILRERIAHRYPNAQLYAERAVMLDEHPPTPLTCYEAELTHTCAHRTPRFRRVKGVSRELGLSSCLDDEAVAARHAPAGAAHASSSTKLILKLWGGSDSN